MSDVSVPRVVISAPGSAVAEQQADIYAEGVAAFAAFHASVVRGELQGVAVPNRLNALMDELRSSSAPADRNAIERVIYQATKLVQRYGTQAQLRSVSTEKFVADLRALLPGDAPSKTQSPEAQARIGAGILRASVDAEESFEAFRAKINPFLASVSDGRVAGVITGYVEKQGSWDKVLAGTGQGHYQAIMDGVRALYT